MILRYRNRAAWHAAKVLLILGSMVIMLSASPSFAAGSRASVAEEPATVRKATLAGVTVTRELPIQHWLHPGEFAWDDEGVPDGPTTIVVNIKGRVLSAYRSGVEIGRSSIIYGADNKPTPTGTYPIMQKKRHHISNLYGAPMPYMMRLTNDGIAIHAAEVADDLATHGCIGIPDEFAALLFQTARVGDRVIIWQGDRLPA